MHKKSRRTRKVRQPRNNQVTLQKETRQQRTISKRQATSAINTIRKIVDCLRPWELSNANKYQTYQAMYMDESVFSALESRITSIENAQFNFRLKHNKNSQESIWLKEFIEYNLRTMKRSVRAVARECGEMIINGISLHEVVASMKTDGEYIGYFTLDDLQQIHPLTLDATKPFETKDNGRDIDVWRQQKSAFVDSSFNFSRMQKQVFSTYGAIPIPANKVATCVYNGSQAMPMGYSPLDAVYNPWREKLLINDYLLTGVQKDLAGTPVLRVPQDLFDQASSDPNSAAAATLNQLQTHMGNLHAGDQSYVILPSDTFSENGSGAPMYDMTFKGIDGVNKNFNLVEIIEQKKKAIFNVLSASHLIAGENGGGSYNLLEGKAGIQAHVSNRDNNVIDDMYNKVVIPMILKLNGLSPKISDIPVYKAGNAQPLSADEKGKFFMRVQRALPIVPDVINNLLETMDVDYRLEDDMDPIKLQELLLLAGLSVNTGESEGSSGTGDTQKTVANSDTNGENAE